MARSSRVTAAVLLVGALVFASCGSGSGNFANSVRHCVGNGGFTSVSRPADLAFALEDLHQRHVEVDYGGGQMRSGYETDFTFAVPSRRAPRYVIAAILNDVAMLPGSRREDLASFAVTLRHPERFDAVMVSRAPAAKAFMARLDSCMADQLQIEGD